MRQSVPIGSLREVRAWLLECLFSAQRAADPVSGSVSFARLSQETVVLRRSALLPARGSLRQATASAPRRAKSRRPQILRSALNTFLLFSFLLTISRLPHQICSRLHRYSKRGERARLFPSESWRRMWPFSSTGFCLAQNTPISAEWHSPQLCLRTPPIQNRPGLLSHPSM